MAREDIFEDMHDEFVHINDDNGAPLYLGVMERDYYNKRDYESSVSVEDRAPIDYCDKCGFKLIHADGESFCLSCNEEIGEPEPVYGPCIHCEWKGECTGDCFHCEYCNPEEIDPEG